MVSSLVVWRKGVWRSGVADDDDGGLVSGEDNGGAEDDLLFELLELLSPICE